METSCLFNMQRIRKNIIFTQNTKLLWIWQNAGKIHLWLMIEMNKIIRLLWKNTFFSSLQNSFQALHIKRIKRCIVLGRSTKSKSILSKTTSHYYICMSSKKRQLKKNDNSKKRSRSARVVGRSGNPWGSRSNVVGIMYPPTPHPPPLVDWHL